jgi:hypothetical protein
MKSETQLIDHHPGESLLQLLTQCLAKVRAPTSVTANQVPTRLDFLVNDRIGDWRCQ